MATRKPNFRPGDTITNGETYLTIEYVVKNSYKFTNGEYMPYSLVDKYWATANDVEIEE